MLIAIFALLLLFAAPARADTIRVDIDSGALFDGIIDGFPGLASFDGEPDIGGNQLGVALKSGVTEERGIAEFPLAAIAALGRVEIRRATLSFNIDDVLTTFGPGTDFSGRAARLLLLHVYAGDGTIALTDFKNISATPHSIDTTSSGTITDASLRASGPISFSVDITGDLLAVLAGSNSHAGIVWRTTDSPTGTSIDDLGDGSVGPPGVGGAQLPYLTIEFEAIAEATPTLALPTPTSTVPPTPTATATVPTIPACDGDCDADATVTVDELVRLINLGLGSGEIDECAAGDRNEDGQITVDEIVRAVVTALDGCG